MNSPCKLLVWIIRIKKLCVVFYKKLLVFIVMKKQLKRAKMHLVEETICEYVAKYYEYLRINDKRTVDKCIFT